MQMIFDKAEVVFDTSRLAPAQGKGRAPNPWSRAHWNTTQQGLTYRADRAEADRLAQAAGHARAVGARFDDAL
jgi:hypothetical protein